MKVRRCFLEVTTVMGPWGSDIVSLAYRRMKDLSSVVLPTPGGPTMATRRGGGSSGSLSTRGAWKRFSLIWELSENVVGRLGSHGQDSRLGIWQLFVQAFRDWQRQKPWDFALWQECQQHCTGEGESEVVWINGSRSDEPPVCFFFSLDLRWGLCVCCSILADCRRQPCDDGSGSIQRLAITNAKKKSHQGGLGEKIGR